MSPSTRDVQPPRLRAVDVQDKFIRRESILDAAAQLYDPQQPLRSVAEVAQQAGLAKGTIYLYFQSKEALYLALHQRHAQAFFEALLARLGDEQASFGSSDMVELVGRHLIDNPNFLPLCGACMNVQPQDADAAIFEDFHRQMQAWLLDAGAGLERRLARLRPGDGVRVLHHGYALVLGLYQLIGRPSACAHQGQSALMPTDFRHEVQAALQGLWTQVETHGVATVTPLHGEAR
jgi:AcrR family transcriptional regulator